MDGGLQPAEIAKQLKVSRATAYRYLNTYENALEGVLKLALATVRGERIE